MRRLLVLLILAATLIFVRSNPVRACSCLPFDATQALAESEGIAEALGVTRQSVHKKHHVRRRRRR